MVKNAFVRITVLLLFVFLGIINCSNNPFVFTSDEIEVRISKNIIDISNKLDIPIYYFISERERLALILWGPLSRENNKINPKQNLHLKLEDVFGYKEGKQIVIFYWSGIDPDINTVKSIVADT